MAAPLGASAILLAATLTAPADTLVVRVDTLITRADSAATQAVRRARPLAPVIAPVESLDWALQRRVQAARSPFWDVTMEGLTDLGSGETVMGVLLLFAAFGGPPGVVVAREAIVALLPVNLAVEVVKLGFDRHRPEGRHRRTNASFPSSHAANAAALAYVLSRRWRRLAPVFWTMALAVAWSRVYLNRHFPSDVVVGSLIGLGLAWFTVRWFSRRAGQAASAAAPKAAPNS